MPYLPIALGILSIASIYTGAGCFIGLIAAVAGTVLGFKSLKSYPDKKLINYAGIVLSVIGLVLTLLVIVGFLAIAVICYFA